MLTFPKTAVYALTPKGLLLGKKISSLLDCELFVNKSLVPFTLDEYKSDHIFSSLKQCVANNFTKYKCHIFIAATGVVVRCIAAHISKKTTDPAILVLDQNAQFVISLLSGHLGKANTYTHLLAEMLNASPIITTATDGEGIPAIDTVAQQKGLHILNPQAIKYVSAALLREETVPTFDPFALLSGINTSDRIFFDYETSVHKAQIHSSLPSHFTKAQEVLDDVYQQNCHFQALHTKEAALLISPFLLHNFPKNLRLIPKIVYAGIGCKRGCTKKEILDALLKSMHELNLAHESLAGIASIDKKSDEAGLLAAAAELEHSSTFFSQETLKGIPCFSFSPKANDLFSVDSVCEAAALSLAGPDSVLLLPKKVIGFVTVALALPSGFL